MLKEINTKKLLIILIFMLVENVNKPNFIRNYINDFPLFKWLIFSLIILKKSNGIIYFIISFTLYQIFYIIDSIYFTL